MHDDSLLRPGRKSYRAASAALVLVGVVTFALLYATQPVLPLIAEAYRLSPTAASLAVSFSTFGLAAGLPLWAAVSDRVGRLRTIVLALVASSLLTVLLAVVSSFPAFALVRLAQGIALAGVPATAMTYLGEEVAPFALGGAIGLYIAGNSIGGMSGRIAIGFASGVFGWQRSLGLLGILALLLVGAAVRALPPSRHFQPRGAGLRAALSEDLALLGRPDLLPLFAVGGFLMAAFVGVYNYLGFLLAGPPYRLGAGIASLVYLFYLVGSAGASGLGRLADRLGRLAVLRASIGLALLGATVTLLGALPLRLLGVGLFTFGFFGGHAAASTLASERGAQSRAASSSLYLVFYYVGSSLGGSLIGFLWEAIGWPGVTLGAALALGPALVCALLA